MMLMSQQLALMLMEMPASLSMDFGWYCREVGLIFCWQSGEENENCYAMTFGGGSWFQ
jgi:hypothetical protein